MPYNYLYVIQVKGFLINNFTSWPYLTSKFWSLIMIYKITMIGLSPCFYICSHAEHITAFRIKQVLTKLCRVIKTKQKHPGNKKVRG